MPGVSPAERTGEIFGSNRSGEMLCGGVDQIGMGVGQTRGLSVHADVLPELVPAYNPLFIRESRRVLKPAPTYHTCKIVVLRVQE